VLERNGPSGGDLKDVLDMKTIITGSDPVLCDSYAAKLMGKEPLSFGYIEQALKLNLGSADILKADILTIAA
jgi:uncharacterized protein (DUF362 family)